MFKLGFLLVEPSTYRDPLENGNCAVQAGQDGRNRMFWSFEARSTSTPW